MIRCVNHLEKIDAGRIWVDGDLVGYRQVGDTTIVREHLGIGDGAQTLYELLRDGARPEYPPPELPHGVCVPFPFPPHKARSTSRDATHSVARNQTAEVCADAAVVCRKRLPLPRRSESWSTGTSEEPA